MMPIACCISEVILCMHGGLSPELVQYDEINAIVRPCDVPEHGLLCDLLWADPEAKIKGFIDSDRGVSYLFGEDMVNEFLDLNDLNLIVRGHQVMDNGYGFFANRQLVTVFSAPNYSGEFDNNGAILQVNDELVCAFKILKGKTIT